MGVKEVTWSGENPKEFGFYWVKWSPTGANFVAEVDSEGTWVMGMDNSVEGQVLYGPRIPYLWE